MVEVDSYGGGAVMVLVSLVIGQTVVETKTVVVVTSPVVQSGAYGGQDVIVDIIVV
jgi:hypothetical protein